MRIFLLQLSLLSLLLTVTMTVAIIDDISALNRLYETTDGDRWTLNNGWGTSDDVCTWFGIHCNPENAVTSVYLPDNNLVGRVAKTVYKMAHLKTLHLQNNKLRSGSFDGFSDEGAATSLKVLNIAGNALTSIDGIANAPSVLTELHLTSNNLAGTFPVEVTQLPNLRDLYLSFNRLEGSLPTQIGNMTALESIFLYGNRMSGSLPTEIGLLDKCKVFTMAENHLSGPIPTQVNNMYNLNTFSIHNREKGSGSLTGPVPTFDKSPFLTLLYLDGNALTGTVPSTLLNNLNTTELSSLVQIGLSDNLLTGGLPLTLLKFSSLTIDLTGNRLTKLDPAFCTRGAWMSGSVEEHGCDGILCAKGTYAAQLGRATDKMNCATCVGSSSTLLGATKCEGTVVDDWYVLAVLYRDLQGSGWNRTEGWNALDDVEATEVGFDGSGLDICSGWHGVTCDDTKRVKNIELTNNGLVGTIPSELFTLPYLRLLDLSKNAITVDSAAGLAAVGSSKSLRQLKVGGTKITSVKGIEQAETLNSLYLDGLNFDSSAFPTELYALSNLQLLHLQFSGLTGALHTDVGKMKGLKQLNLYNNDLTGTLPTELGRLTDMFMFELSENIFNGKLPTELDLMTSMETFHIHQSGGGITGTLPAFDKYPLLTALSLDNNKFSGSIPPNFLQGIPADAKDFLHITVSLTYNEITSTIPKELANFKHLDIRLEGNKISGIAEEVCTLGSWMNGQVGKLGDTCDAILCPDKMYNLYGKKSVGSECLDCPSAEFYGSVFCENENPNPEKTILDALFKATGGRYWTKATNWTDPGVPICFRQGIVCTGSDVPESGVFEINLLANGLKGVIPPEVFDLKDVRELGFTNNDVDISFQNIGNASSLVVLKLSHTQVTSLDGIDKAPSSLSELHLAGIGLQGPIPSVVYKMNSVTKLFLNNNLFTGSISESVIDLVNLEQLYLARNKLTGHIPSELGKLQALNTIDLEINSLSGNLPTQLENLPLLGHLLLHGQQSDKKLSGRLLTFSKSDRIREIDLSNNDFTGTIPVNFLALMPGDDSVNIDLASNRIGGSLPSTLKTFTSVNINLADNRIVQLFDDDTCDVNTDWMLGSFGDVGSCDAILCKPGYASTEGRQITTDAPCTMCPGFLVDAPFFGSTSCKSHVEGTETDVLKKIYTGTNGTNWITRTNWNSDKNICAWFGVVCGESGVTELNLDSNGLEASGDVSRLIFSLRHLEKLDIKGNKVPLDLREIQDENKLRSLKISATGLKSIDGLTKASDMRRLHITDNDLIGSFPQDILKLTELRSLYLSFNSFDGTLPSEIGDLSNLEEFYIFGNKIKGQLPGDAIAKLSNMREFVMSNNYLTGTIPNEFNSLALLEQLSLYDQQSDTLISGTVPNFLGAPAMWYFDVTGNDLTGSIPNDFMKNSKWHDSNVTVYLGNNELTGTVPSELNIFTSLDIEIIGNLITGLPSALCDADNAKWMQGQVGTIDSCDAIACPPGKFNDEGRQDASDNPCQTCAILKGDNRYGQTHCEDISAEKATLNALYAATGGKNWSNRSKWTSGEPICSWEGVVCENGNVDDNSGITGIDLENNAMVGTIPKSIWKLPFLKDLNVKYNDDLYLNFDGLSAASSLEVLYLSRIRIDSLRGISQASSLRQLHITKCGISGPFPDELFDLGATLDSLFMEYNAMTGTLSTRFGELTNLEVFYAYDNEFSGKIPSQIGMMSSLHRIVLAENLLSGAIPSEVSNLHNLQLFSAFRLNKPGAKLSGPLPSFNQNPKLTDLYLTNNHISGKIPDDFLSASQAAELIILSHNRLEGVVPEALSALPMLDLQLEENMITAFPPIFCNNSQWMGGDVGKVGCTAFLCPIGTWTPLGRASAIKDYQCTRCGVDGAAKYYGSTSCDVEVAERALLLQLYSECGGTEWYNNYGWASSEPHCNWFGINCEGGQFGKVVSLNLGSNNLIGYPPGAIFKLPELETLELHANPLNGFRFDNITLAKKLTTIRLDSTGVSSLEGIEEALALTSLDVRFNNLEGPFPKGVLSLNQLRYLNLGNNKMSGPLPIGSFSEFQYLKTLRLGSNEFTGKVPAFHVNTGLTTIDLSNNKLSGTIADNFLFSKTTSVAIEINLSNNQVTGRVPVELERFEDLTLYLRGNQISGVPDDLCEKTNWNGGDVGKYGCDAILCPPGTFGFVGRARDDEPCVGCRDEILVYGQTECENLSSAFVLVRMSLSTIVAITVATDRKSVV